MGRRSMGIFDSDAARDLVDQVKTSPDNRVLLRTLVARASLSILGLSSDQVVAAAELIATAAKRERSTSGVLLAWQPSSDDCLIAARALEHAARREQQSDRSEQQREQRRELLDSLHRALGGHGLPG